MIRFLVNVAIIIICIFSFSNSIFSSDLDANSIHIQWIKIYMVEPESRWNDYWDRPYHFAFLDYAYDTTIIINDGDSLKRTITWNSITAGYGNIVNENIMAIAVVCNGTAVTGYANPPTGNPFSAYAVEACAAATPSQSWPNYHDETFSHTIFAEEGTATWCYNCPVMADSLHEIYTNSGFPFFYVALVSDMVTEAYDRYYTELNRFGDPTCYYDGGIDVMVGNGYSLSEYEQCILNAGAREVVPMDLSLDLALQGESQVIIDLNLHVGSHSDVNDEDNSLLPDDFTLKQNYPNPFNPGTEIGFSLKRRADIEISVYDLLGRKIRTLINKNMSAGNHSVSWDGLDENGREVASGIYIYKMSGSDFSLTKKMVLLK